MHYPEIEFSQEPQPTRGSGARASLDLSTKILDEIGLGIRHFNRVQAAAEPAIRISPVRHTESWQVLEIGTIPEPRDSSSKKAPELSELDKSKVARDTALAGSSIPAAEKLLIMDLMKKVEQQQKSGTLSEDYLTRLNNSMVAYFQLNRSAEVVSHLHKLLPTPPTDAKTRSAEKSEAPKERTMESKPRNRDLEADKERLLDVAASRMSVSELTLLKEGMAKLEGNSSMSREKIGAFYKQVDKLLRADSSALLNSEQRRILALQLMEHAASPTDISQGYNNTCQTTAMMVKLFNDSPAKAAGIVVNLAISGSHKLPDGQTITPSRYGITHAELAEAKVPVPDGQRSWAMRMLNHAAVQCYWENITSTPDGKPCPKGSIVYQQYGQQGDDSGERLLVRYGNTYVLATDEKGEVIKHPAIRLSELTGVYNKLTGENHKDLILTRDLPRPGCKSSSTQDELHKALAEAKEKGRFPVLVLIPTDHNPDPLAQDPDGKPHDATHICTIHDYDPATGLVKVDNQWKSDKDYLSDKKRVHIRRLFNVMKYIPK